MANPSAHSNDSALDQVGGEARVKVCGITEPSELGVLASRGVDFVGLWWGVLWAEIGSVAGAAAGVRRA